MGWNYRLYHRNSVEDIVHYITYCSLYKSPLGNLVLVLALEQTVKHIKITFPSFLPWLTGSLELNFKLDHSKYLESNSQYNCDLFLQQNHPRLVQFSSSVRSDSLWPHGLQHTRLPCPSPTLGAYSNSCPSSQWCHPTITSSFGPFSSRLQSFPASGSFLVSQFFASGG